MASQADIVIKNQGGVAMLPNPIFLNTHMYGIMVAVGILFAFVVLTYLLKKKNTDKKFADFLFL